MRKTTIAALTAVVGVLMFSLMVMPLFSVTGAAAAPALQTTATELATSAAVATDAATSAPLATEAATEAATSAAVATEAATSAPTAMMAATSAPTAMMAATTTAAATPTRAPSTLPNTGGDSGASTLMLGVAALIIIGVAAALLMGRRRDVGM